MSKKRVNRYENAFREMALERMKSCESPKLLAKELGIHRSLLYQWRGHMERVADEAGPPSHTPEQALRVEVSHLKRLLGEKTLEVDFFKGALQKVEARRRNSSDSGAKGSTTESGS